MRIFLWMSIQEEKREKLEISRARSSLQRSRRAASDLERPPALQHVAELVPQGPLNTLRACLGSRERRLRVVTRHRKGVRGIATGTSLSLLYVDTKRHACQEFDCQRVA